MEESSATAPLGRILIVDDDPVAAGMLNVSLTTAGYVCFEASSGEEALSMLENTAEIALTGRPDAVFLDIEMGTGIDGYQTCRNLRELEATRDIPVIFLSGHDSLEDRLLAYDAGGSDFVAKPFSPIEVLRKVQLVISHRVQQDAVGEANRQAFDNAKNVLTNLEDIGVALKFSRSALGCRTLNSLAVLAIESMSAFGVHCHMQLRTPETTLTLTLQGPASPLEVSVIEMSRSMDRIFRFSNRIVVNYDSCSLLITDMPVADEELCGRIRDQAAIIAESADLAVGNIVLRTEAIQRAEGLRKLAEVSRTAIEDLRGRYRDLQLATRLEFETMTDTIEEMYVHLGLSSHQEFAISDIVRRAVDQVLTKFEDVIILDRDFAHIAEELTKAGEYSISQEEEAPMKVSVW